MRKHLYKQSIHDKVCRMDVSSGSRIGRMSLVIKIRGIREHRALGTTIKWLLPNDQGLDKAKSWIKGSNHGLPVMAAANPSVRGIGAIQV